MHKRLKTSAINRYPAYRRIKAIRHRHAVVTGVVPMLMRHLGCGRMHQAINGLRQRR